MDDYDWMGLARSTQSSWLNSACSTGLDHAEADQAAAAHLRTEIERDFVPRGEVEKLREALAWTVNHFETVPGKVSAGQIPGHAHKIAGQWDDTGLPCENCAKWLKVKAALGGDHG